MTRLAAELRELSSRPPAGYTDEPTGETFRQAWEKRDLKGRRQLMLQAGFRLEVGLVNGEPAVMHFLDPDLARRAGKAARSASFAMSLRNSSTAKPSIRRTSR